MKDDVYTGRKKIYTSFPPDHNFTREEVIKVVNNSLSKHLDNAREIKRLIEFYKGKQDILGRVKTVRKDVDNKMVINYALATTRDIVGYTFGKPVTYTQRKTESRNAIVRLNDYMEMEDKPALDQELANYNSICGVSYRGIFPNEVVSVVDDVPFELINLNPETSFIIYSYKIGNGPVLGITYFYDKSEDKTTYYIYSYNKVFEVVATGEMGTISDTDTVMESPHILGAIPIVEYNNNQWRMGHWECAISVLNMINLVGSDSVNDVVQFVNSILVAINAEIDQDVLTDIETYKMASIRSPQGLVADLKYISSQLDSNGVQILRQYLEDAYHIIVGVPDRKMRGTGGDTGEAVKLRDGFQDMEIVARTTEMFFKRSEKQVLTIVLNILKQNNIEEFKNIKLMDIDIKFTRNKTDNLQTKVQAGSTLNAMGLYDPVDITDLMDITTDPQEMVDRGKLYQDQKRQENLEFMKEEQQISQQNAGGTNNSTTNNRGNVSNSKGE